MKLTRILGVVLAVVCLVTLTVGCGAQTPPATSAPTVAPATAAPATAAPAKKYTIGFVIPGPDVYYNFGKEGVKYVVETSGNTYTERNSENNTVKEIQNVQDLIAAQVDAILLMTTNADTGAKACQLANEAKIPIFLVDCSVTEGTGKAQGQVEMFQPDIGRLMGEYVVQKHPGAQFVVLAGLPGQPGGEAQKKGFLDAMAKDPAAKLLSEVQYADWDRKKGEDLMRNYLVMHKKIDVVYAMNEEMAYGAYTAIKDAGREKEMVIVSANGSAVGKEMLAAGSLEATVGWSPSENGMLCTLKCLDYLSGKPQDYRTEVPLGLYTKDNLDKYSNWDAKDMAKKYEPILKEKGYIK